MASQLQPDDGFLDEFLGDFGTETAKFDEFLKSSGECDVPSQQQAASGAKNAKKGQQGEWSISMEYIEEELINNKNELKDVFGEFDDSVLPKIDEAEVNEAPIENEVDEAISPGEGKDKAAPATVNVVLNTKMPSSIQIKTDKWSSVSHDSKRVNLVLEKMSKEKETAEKEREAQRGVMGYGQMLSNTPNMMKDPDDAGHTATFFPTLGEQGDTPNAPDKKAEEKKPVVMPTPASSAPAAPYQPSAFVPSFASLGSTAPGAAATADLSGVLSSVFSPQATAAPKSCASQPAPTAAPSNTGTNGNAYQPTGYAARFAPAVGAMQQQTKPSAASGYAAKIDLSGLKSTLPVASGAQPAATSGGYGAKVQQSGYYPKFSFPPAK